MPDSPHTADIVERLERKHRVQPVLGGGSIGTDANGQTTSTSYITDDGMRLVNPDGPEAAAEIKALRADNAELMRVAKEQTEVIAELEDEIAALKDHRKVLS